MPLSSDVTAPKRVLHPTFRSFRQPKTATKTYNSCDDDDLDFGEDVQAVEFARHQKRVDAKTFLLDTEILECDCGRRHLTLREKLCRILHLLRQ